MEPDHGAPGAGRVRRKSGDSGRLGASAVGVWIIKNVLAPVHRRLYRITGGRAVRCGRLANTLLLTTTGRRTGRRRTTPLFYVESGDRYIICNVRPSSEPTNPWVLNLRAEPSATLQVGSEVIPCRATELDDDEVHRFWPLFVDLWPAYARHHERTGQRTMFAMTPLRPQAAWTNRRRGRTHRSRTKTTPGANSGGRLTW